MPVLGRFYGIVTYMNYRDPEPPHFHARYQSREVLVEIESGLVTGIFSGTALRLLFEWMELHREELERNWVLARNKEPLEPIEPLRDPEFFARVSVNPETGTIEWPNGADLAPEFLLEKGTDAEQVA